MVSSRSEKSNIIVVFKPSFGYRDNTKVKINRVKIDFKLFKILTKASNVNVKCIITNSTAFPEQFYQMCFNKLATFVC